MINREYTAKLLNLEEVIITEEMKKATVAEKNKKAKGTKRFLLPCKKKNIRMGYFVVKYNYSGCVIM